MTGNKKIQLLFIDDSPTNHHLVRKTVENSEIEYTGCTSSEEARELLQTRFFDVIAQDVIRANDEMNGFMFTTWLRRRCPNLAQRKVPIIIISMLDEEQLKKEKKQCGFDTYFDPCYIQERLVSTIESLLKGTSDVN